MKIKNIILSAILPILVVCGVAFSDYFPDIIVTSPDGIWTDTRAYSTLSDALSAIGTNERDLYIVRQETATTLAIQENISLHFLASGSISNSGQLTVNTKNIFAGNRRIFTGTGDIDFAYGSTVSSSWFSDISEAIDITSDDHLTLVVSEQCFADTSVSVGNDVVLKWESPGNFISANAGVEISNIKNIEAGRYLLFSGAGDFDFADGAQLNSGWFRRFRSIIGWVENENVTVFVDQPETISYTRTVPDNMGLIVRKGGELNISAGVTLTLDSSAELIGDITGNGSIATNTGSLHCEGGTISVSGNIDLDGPFEAGLYQVFSGTGSVSFGSGAVEYVVPQWWGAVGDGATDDVVAIQTAIDTDRPVNIPYTDTSYVITTPLYLDSKGSIYSNPGLPAVIKKTTNTAGSGSNTMGGVTDSYVKDAAIIIRHADNTYAYYVSIKNINIDCVVDNDYGIFAPRVGLSVFSNINIEIGDGLYGYVTHNTYMTTFTDIQIRKNYNYTVGSIGVYFDDLGVGASGTSCIFTRVWVHDGFEIGYKFTGLVYSTMNGCAVDRYSKQAIYFSLCDMTLNGFGFEDRATLGDTPIYSRGSRIVANNLVGFTVNIAAGQYVIDHGGGTFIVHGLRHTTTIAGGTSVKVSDNATFDGTGLAWGNHLTSKIPTVDATSSYINHSNGKMYGIARNTIAGVTASLAQNAVETIFTALTTQAYLVIVACGAGDNTAWHGTFLVYYGNVTAVIATVNAQNVDCVASGADIQVKNLSGSATTLKWSYLRLR